MLLVCLDWNEGFYQDVLAENKEVFSVVFTDRLNNLYSDRLRQIFLTWRKNKSGGNCIWWGNVLWNDVFWKGFSVLVFCLGGNCLWKILEEIFLRLPFIEKIAYQKNLKSKCWEESFPENFVSKKVLHRFSKQVFSIKKLWGCNLSWNCF